MIYEPTGIFRAGFSKAEVEGILAKAKDVFLNDGGEQVVSWSSAGNQATHRLALTADQLIHECVYALQLLDPENYPSTPDRTVVAFHSQTVNDFS